MAELTPEAAAILAWAERTAVEIGDCGATTALVGALHVLSLELAALRAEIAKGNRITAITAGGMRR